MDVMRVLEKVWTRVLGVEVYTGKDPLFITHPHLVSEWDYEKSGDLTPNDVTAGSDKVVPWKCSKGHKWKTTINNRTKKIPTGCPYCYKKNRKK